MNHPLSNLTENPFTISNRSHDTQEPLSEVTQGDSPFSICGRRSFALLLVTLILGWAGTAWSAEIRVDTTAASSSSACTLADAIATGNTGTPTGACEWDGEGNPVIVLPPAIYETRGVLPFVISSGVKMTIKGEDFFSTDATIRRREFDPRANFFRVIGKLTLNHVTLTGGEHGVGGSISVYHSGILKLRHCQFLENSALGIGGAISNNGTLSIKDCIFRDNSAGVYGGAIYSSYWSTLTISRSTFVDNVATTDGGAIAFYGKPDVGLNLTIENSTFSSNDGNWGGALAVNNGSASVDMSTFKDNTAMTFGSAIAVDPAATLSIKRTAVAGCAHCDPATVDLCDGPITSDGHNVAEDSSCTFTQSTDTQTTDQQPLKLSGLLDNHGGLTPVHVPLCDWDPQTGECHSYLINKSICHGLERDQRDHFTRDNGFTHYATGEACDIGAYESVHPQIYETNTTQRIRLKGYDSWEGPNSTKLITSGGLVPNKLPFPVDDAEAKCQVWWTAPLTPFILKRVILIDTAACVHNCLQNPGACAEDLTCHLTMPTGWAELTSSFVHEDFLPSRDAGLEILCATAELPRYVVEYVHEDHPEKLHRWDPVNPIDQ